MIKCPSCKAVNHCNKDLMADKNAEMTNILFELSVRTGEIVGMCQVCDYCGLKSEFEE